MGGDLSGSERTSLISSSGRRRLRRGHYQAHSSSRLLWCIAFLSVFRAVLLISLADRCQRWSLLCREVRDGLCFCRDLLDGLVIRELLELFFVRCLWIHILRLFVRSVLHVFRCFTGGGAPRRRRHCGGSCLNICLRRLAVPELRTQLLFIVLMPCALCGALGHSLLRAWDGRVGISVRRLCRTQGQGHVLAVDWGCCFFRLSGGIAVSIVSDLLIAANTSFHWLRQATLLLSNRDVALVRDFTKQLLSGHLGHKRGLVSLHSNTSGSIASRHARICSQRGIGSKHRRKFRRLHEFVVLRGAPADSGPRGDGLLSFKIDLLCHGSLELRQLMICSLCAAC
mmetsp:Transcript_32540/g.92274  ORF Transcript_32540/g.92274 Transcript_32540/m.92274 type:complete len:340 (-) Transcript_32540:585-1604(-)